MDHGVNALAYVGSLGALVATSLFHITFFDTNGEVGLPLTQAGDFVVGPTHTRGTQTPLRFRNSTFQVLQLILGVLFAARPETPRRF